MFFYYRDDIKLLMRVGGPVSLTRLIMLSSGIIYTLLIARLGIDALAASALISVIYNTLIMMVAGFFLPIGIFTAKNLGAAQYSSIGEIVHQSIILSFLVAFPLYVIIKFLYPILLFFHQPAPISMMVASYFQGIIYGGMANIWLVIINLFLTGILQTTIVSVSTIFSLMLTVFLGRIFIYGGIGIHPMGMIGMSYAISLVWWVRFIIMIVYLQLPQYRKFNLFQVSFKSLHYLKSIFRHGWPIGLQHGLEFASAITFTCLIGILGKNALIAQQISAQSNIVAAIVPLGLSQTVATIVAKVVGEGKPYLIKRYVYLSIVVGVIINLILIIFYLSFSNVVSVWYLGKSAIYDQKLLNLIWEFLLVSAPTQLFITISYILVGALRGIHDEKYAMISSIIFYWGVGVIVAYLFLHYYHDPVLIRVGYSIGIGCYTVALWRRFLQHGIIAK